MMTKTTIYAFWRGMARTLDIGAVGSRYFAPAANTRTDAEMLRSDWVNVGNYLR